MLKQLNNSDEVLFKSLSTDYLNRMPDPDDPADPDDPSTDDDATDPMGPPPASGN